MVWSFFPPHKKFYQNTSKQVPTHFIAEESKKNMTKDNLKTKKKKKNPHNQSKQPSIFLFLAELMASGHFRRVVLVKEE